MVRLIAVWRVTDLGFHPANANSGLIPVCDGLLVSRIENINELGIVCSRRTVI